MKKSGESRVKLSEFEFQFHYLLVEHVPSTLFVSVSSSVECG